LRRELNELTGLPAVAAISTVAATTSITTIAAASTATTASTTAATMSTATATEATAASPTTTATLLLRTSFVDHQIASTKVLAVEGIYRAIGFFVVGNLDKSETTRLARKTVTNQIDCRGVNTRL
jgi:hypothetical protein